VRGGGGGGGWGDDSSLLGRLGDQSHLGSLNLGGGGGGGGVVGVAFLLNPENTF